MPITPIGLLIVPLGIFIAIVHPRKLLPLMVFCSVFQASSVSGLFGLTPYAYVGLILLIRYVLEGAYTLRLHVSRTMVPAILFWLWCVASAFVLPIAFAGMPVLNPQLPLEQIEQGAVPLHLSASNIFQAVLLTINIVALMEAIRTKSNCWPAFRLGAIVATAIVFIQVVARNRFPYFLINNNPAYGQAHLDTSLGLLRPSGTFVEPSTAGAYFCGISCFCLVRYLLGKMPLWKCLLAVGTLVIVGSTSALLAFATLLVIIAAQYRPWRSLNIRLTLVKRWSILTAFLVLPVIAVAPLARHLIENTAGKQDSYSMLIRAGVDAFAFHVLLESHGIGVGLGSIRASSFVFTLLANIGCVGLVLFCWFLKRVRITWLSVGTLAVMAIGVPDISLAVLWASLMVAPGLEQNAVTTVQTRGDCSDRLAGQNLART